MRRRDERVVVGYTVVSNSRSARELGTLGEFLLEPKRRG